MRRAVVILALWLLGVGSGLTYVALTGGWYEYHYTTDAEYGTGLERLVNDQGWQFVPDLPQATGVTVRYMRRPRLHLP